MRHNMLSQASASVIERLEQRMLLSTSLGANGVLNIFGTSGQDLITVSKGGGFIKVVNDGKVSSYPKSAITKIFYDGGFDTDKFEMQRDITIPVEAYSRTGNDTIVTGAGNDTIYGGCGDGFIDAGDGNNLVYGKTGDHRIITGSGNDTFYSGRGFQTVNSGSGHDVFYGGNFVKNTGSAILYQPMSQATYKSQAFQPNVTGFDPLQIRQAYDIGFNPADGTYQTQESFNGRGAGQTIYIVDAFSGAHTRQDLITFSRGFDLPVPTDDTFQIVNANPTGRAPAVDGGWALEINLDLQWAHAIAPGAKLVLVQADSNFEADIYQAVLVAAQLASTNGGVVSMSFGRAGGLPNGALLDNVFQTYSNVTFVAASGDKSVVTYPAGSPFVTAVGGTVLTLDSQGAQVAPEVAWTTGGGGPAFNYERPTYQDNITFFQAAGVPLGIQNVRGVPDVSYNAGAGVAVFTTTTVTGTDSAADRNTGWFGVGGTSAGTPQWAALIATTNQKRAQAGAKPIGNGLNSLLYQLYSNDVGSDSNMLPFNDIVAGTASGFAALPGYDLATGLGTPSGDNLCFWLSTFQPFFIQQSFTFSTTLLLPSDTPSTIVGAKPVFNQPRGGSGLLTGGSRVELTFVTTNSNPWLNPSQNPTPDQYFDIITDPDASLQSVHLFRTQNPGDPNSGSIYGNGTVTVFNYDNAIALPGGATFTVKYSGEWSTDAAGNTQFDVAYQAVDPLTNQPLQFSAYTSKFRPLDPTHGGYVSGELTSA